MVAADATFRFKVLSDGETVELVSVTNKNEATIARIPAKVKHQPSSGWEIEGAADGTTMYDVVQIASHAFESCPNLTVVDIQAPIKTVEAEAFKTGLHPVEIFFKNPKALNSIASKAFWTGDDNTYNTVWFYEYDPDPSKHPAYNYNWSTSQMNLTELAPYLRDVKAAFYHTKVAKNIIWNENEDIPNGLLAYAKAYKDDGTGFIFKFSKGGTFTKVGDIAFQRSDLYAFGYPDVDNKYSLPASLNTVGKSAFATCTKVVPAFGFKHEDGVDARITDVGDNAFQNSPNIVKDNTFFNIFAKFEDVNEGGLKYGKYSFEGCDLTVIDLLKSSIVTIPNYAFAKQKNQVTKLVLPGGCTVIGEGAFMNDQIVVLNFPATLTTIDKYAFAETANLATQFNLVGGGKTYVQNFPSALTSIGVDAFKNRTTEDIYTHGYVTNGKEYTFPVLKSQTYFYITGFVYLPAQAVSSGKSDLLSTMKASGGGWGDYHLKYPKFKQTTVDMANVTYAVGPQNPSGLYPVQVTKFNNGSPATLYAQFIKNAAVKDDDTDFPAGTGYVSGFYFDGFADTPSGKKFNHNDASGAVAGDIAFANTITFDTDKQAIRQEFDHDPLSKGFIWSDEVLDKAYDPTKFAELPKETFAKYTKLTGVTFNTAKTYTKIAESAFEGCTALKGVTANNVTVIGDKAFKGNVALETVTAPAVTTIGEEAFLDDAKLATFTDFSKVTAIRAYAFQNTTSLNGVEFTKTLTVLGNSAFYNSGITSVKTADEGSVTIANSVFSNCANLTTVEAPAFTTFVGSSAFANCPKLATVKIDGASEIFDQEFQNSGNEGAGLVVSANKATKIRANAFTDAKVVSFTGDALTTLDATAFQNCTDLKSFSAKVLEEIPALAFKKAGTELAMDIPAVKTICDGAFQFSGVVSINNDGTNVIESVGNYAFNGSTIKNVNLPKINTLYGFAYAGCQNLETVKAGENLKTIALNTFQNAGADTKFEVTLDGVETINKDAFNASKLTSIVLPKLTTIADQTSFKDCSKLLSFKADVLTTIPESAFAGAGAEGFAVTAEKLQTIGKEAFNGSALATIDALAVKTIGVDAFKGTKLVKVEFPVVQTVNGGAFKDCADLENVLLNDAEKDGAPAFGVLVGNTFTGAGVEGKFTVTTAAGHIDANAFTGSKVETVNATKVTTLNAYAFAGCTTLKHFNAPVLTEIFASTFAGADDDNPNSIETVSLPKVKAIGANAFNVSNLKELGNTPALETIGANAFRKTQLENIKFPATLATMGAAAFAKSALKTADFSEATAFTEIPERAFMYCASLEEVNLGNVASVGASAFANTAIEEITLPATLTTFAVDAFKNDVLSAVNVSYATVPALNVDPFAFNAETGKYVATLFVKDGEGIATRDAYIANTNWDKFIINSAVNILVNDVRIASDKDGVYTLVDGADKVVIDGNYSGKFEYVRNFTSTAWQCWFVPFAIEAGSEAAQGARFAMLYDTDYKDGTTTIEYKEVAPGTIIKANVPYLVKPAATGEVTFEADQVMKTQANKKVEVSNVDNVYTFQGTYVKKGYNRSAPWYGLVAKNGSFALAGETAYISAYRFYMTVKDNNNDYVKFVVLDDADATGISDINANEIAEGAMFDLQGRKISAPVKGQVYIQNGVKKLAR